MYLCIPLESQLKVLLLEHFGGCFELNLDLKLGIVLVGSYIFVIYERREGEQRRSNGVASLGVAM